MPNVPRLQTSKRCGNSEQVPKKAVPNVPRLQTLKICGTMCEFVEKLLNVPRLQTSKRCGNSVKSS